MTDDEPDCGAMLGLIADADPKDPTALRDPVPDSLPGTCTRLGACTPGWRSSA